MCTSECPARWLFPREIIMSRRREWSGLLEKRPGCFPIGKADETWALCSRRVVTAAGMRAAMVVIAGEKIVDVTDVMKRPDSLRVEDVGDRVVLPGLVDTHVHINEPGRTEWEGFATATCAAAAGGITTLVDMPLNSSPVTTTVEALALKLQSTRDQPLGRLRILWRNRAGRDRTDRAIDRCGRAWLQGVPLPLGNR